MGAENTLIIIRPRGQSRGQAATSAVLGVVGWAAWSLLWIPMVTALMWVSGVKLAYARLFSAAGGGSLAVVAWIVAIDFSLVAGWTIYRRIRPRKLGQRRHAEVVPKRQIGLAFGVCHATTMNLLLSERRLDLHFDDAGQLIGVEPARVEESVLCAD
jgi:poly-beta-1,6-N-acetyl-D-glucosamine biosynthesis protein PgaD